MLRSWRLPEQKGDSQKTLQSCLTSNQIWLINSVACFLSHLLTPFFVWRSPDVTIHANIFFHIQVSLFYFFFNPTHKTETGTGQQIRGWVGYY